MGIGGHKIRNGSAQFVIGGALAIQGSDLTRGAPALIIVPDIVSVQAVRDGISPDADAGEQRRLSANRNLFVVFGHCMKGHKAFLLRFQ